MEPLREGATPPRKPIDVLIPYNAVLVGSRVRSDGCWRSTGTEQHVQAAEATVRTPWCVTLNVPDVGRHDTQHHGSR
jgi:hypothetical protein